MTENIQVFERAIRQEVDQQVLTAKQFPRSIERFLSTAERLCTMTEDIASECIYSLPRRNKDGGESAIEGPSARFAELLCACYGNARIATRVLDILPNDAFVTAQAVFFDVENNVARSIEVKRRITNSRGQRFGDDMIGVTANAASSIAARNAVLAGIPRAIWDGIFERAKRKAIGDVQTLESRRSQALGHFAKMGISESRVLAVLGVSNALDIDAEMLLKLKGMASALRDGDAKIDDLFPEVRPASIQQAALAALANNFTPAVAVAIDDRPPVTSHMDAASIICQSSGCIKEAMNGSTYCEDHAFTGKKRK